MKTMFLGLLLVIVTAIQSAAQCAMCRSTLQNNFSNGDPGIASGINTGILFLLALPYLAVAIIGFLWYKSSRNAANVLVKRPG